MSHGCNKAETANAEQLFIKLVQDMADEAENAVSGSADFSQRAAQLLKTNATGAGKAFASPRDAAALQDGATEPASSIGAGNSSARDTGVTPRGAAAASAAAMPRAAQTNQLLDYDMFEQLWLSDLSNLSGK